jgi:hypothetical protein
MNKKNHAIKLVYRRVYYGAKLLLLIPQLSLSKPSNKVVSERRSLITSKSEDLAELFIKHGSDKATMHDYWKIYGSELARLHGESIRILEIGLGTNNPEIPSNMGGHFLSGGSLRAFSEFVPQAKVYGADIDKEILFKEGNIETCWVDQTNKKTFLHIYSLIEYNALDIIIVDGLHQPYADLSSVCHLIRFLKIQGSIFVEDIEDSFAVRVIWRLTAAILRKKGYVPNLIQMKGGLVFWIRRLK